MAINKLLTQRSMSAPRGAERRCQECSPVICMLTCGAPEGARPPLSADPIVANIGMHESVTNPCGSLYHH